MKRTLFGLLVAAGLAATAVLAADAATAKPPLGLPPVPVPADNPQTPEKIALGDKLFDDKRFSSTGQVACATCHDTKKAFTDSPLRTSEGIKKGGKALTGTRNAPTVVNAAYFDAQFWDGRSPSLEDQSQHPFINPVEMGLKDHQPILKIVRSDPEYVKAFEQVFGKKGAQVTMKEVKQAIGAFERTQVSGNSPFDRYFYGGESDALTDAQKRGFDLYVNKGRCVSCHVIEQTQALFTDNRFHNVGVGINDIQKDVPASGRRVPAGEGDARRGGREGARRQAHLGARALRHLPRLRGPRRVQDADAAQRGGHPALHARRQPGDAEGRDRPLQQRRRDEGRRPRQRLPQRRHPPAQPDRRRRSTTSCRSWRR